MRSCAGRKVYSELTGWGRVFNGYRKDTYEKSGLGLKKAMSLAIHSAGLDASKISYISSAANSTPEADVIDSGAVKDVFAGNSGDVAISSVKSMIGECYSASGAFEVAGALAALEDQMVPPTINYLSKDAKGDLNYVVNHPRDYRIDHVLVPAFGPGGEQFVFGCF